MNAIAKMLHASPSTILRVDTTLRRQHAQPPELQETGTVAFELDEMWHYLRKNKNAGFGKFWIVILENLSTGNGVIAIKQPSENSSDA